MLTDAKALARNRARADDAALFLHRRAADGIEERLQEVNRTFTKPAVVTGFPDFWHMAFPDARMVNEGEVLDLAQGAHDLLIHAFGLHWTEDPVGQLVQCRRALRPDGLLLAVCFGGQTLSELRAALAEAEVQLTGGLSPRVAPMGELRDLGGLPSRAGLTLTVADTDRVAVTYPGMMALLSDLRAMGEGNALAERSRRPSRRDLFPLAASIYAASYPAADDPTRVRATFEMVTLTGWAPDESQPQPLRPGAATTRLADALDVPELRANDPARPRDD